eukprot:364654-Chlamydomonas_euryale.AAC.5
MEALRAPRLGMAHAHSVAVPFRGGAAWQAASEVAGPFRGGVAWQSPSADALRGRPPLRRRCLAGPFKGGGRPLQRRRCAVSVEVSIAGPQCDRQCDRQLPPSPLQRLHDGLRPCSCRCQQLHLLQALSLDLRQRHGSDEVVSGAAAEAATDAAGEDATKLAAEDATELAAETATEFAAKDMTDFAAEAWQQRTQQLAASCNTYVAHDRGRYSELQSGCNRTQHLRLQVATGPMRWMAALPVAAGVMDGRPVASKRWMAGPPCSSNIPDGRTACGSHMLGDKPPLHLEQRHSLKRRHLFGAATCPMGGLAVAGYWRMAGPPGREACPTARPLWSSDMPNGWPDRGR